MQKMEGHFISEELYALVLRCESRFGPSQSTHLQIEEKRKLGTYPIIQKTLEYLVPYLGADPHLEIYA